VSFLSDTADGYDRVAPAYALKFFDELAHKPKDREMLDRFAEEVRGKGPVCDLGCGPGEVARYLRDRGLTEIFGLDLSPGMLAEARRLNPDIPFRQGNMLALEDRDRSWAGITAFYSVIHIPRPRVVEALTELRRVLRPGGLLLVVFHLGSVVIHPGSFLDQPVAIDWILFETEEMIGYLRQAGFERIEAVERDPYPEPPGLEHQGRRAYVFARRPAELDSVGNGGPSGP
jgi:SAM-dependent methyltransferase